MGGVQFLSELGLLIEVFQIESVRVLESFCEVALGVQIPPASVLEDRVESL